jgi:iron complex transport system permease protein
MGNEFAWKSDDLEKDRAVALMGAAVALSADILAQMPGRQSFLPLNAVTALLGSPVIVWLILCRNNLQKAFKG